MGVARKISDDLQRVHGGGSGYGTVTQLQQDGVLQVRIAVTLAAALGASGHGGAPGHHGAQLRHLVERHRLGPVLALDRLTACG